MIDIPRGEVSHQVFQQLYLPVLSSQLTTHPLSLNSPISRHYLYFSLRANEGVSMKRIQAPQSQQFEQDYMSEGKTEGKISIYKDDQSVSQSLKTITKPHQILQTWLSLSQNNEQFIHPVQHYCSDATQVQYVTPKANQSLEEYLRAQKENKQITSLTMFQVASQIVKVLSIFESANCFHLNLSPFNFLIDDQNDETRIKVTDFGAKAIVVRQYFEMLQQYITNHAIARRLQTRAGEINNEVDETLLNISNFGKSHFKNKLDQWLAASMDTDIFLKSLIVDLVRLGSLKDTLKRIIIMFMIYDKILAVATIICLVQTYSFDELQSDLKLKLEKEQNQGSLDLKTLVKLLQIHLTEVFDSQQNEKEIDSNLKVIQSTCRQLLNETDPDSILTKIEKKQEQQICKSLLLMFNTQLSSSQVFESESENDNTSRENSPQLLRQNYFVEDLPQKIIPVPVQQSVEEEVPVKPQDKQTVILVTNLPQRSSILIQEPNYVNLGWKNVIDLYDQDTIQNYFRNLSTTQLNMTRQDTFIVIKASNNALNFFLQNRAYKNFFIRPNTQIYLKFTYSPAEDLNGWFRLFQGCGATTQLDCDSKQLVGDHQVQKLTQGVLLLNNLTSFRAYFPDNPLKDETVYFQLSSYLFCFPQLEDVQLSFQCKDDSAHLSIPNKPKDLNELKYLLSPQAMLKKLQLHIETSIENSNLKKLKIDFTNQPNIIHLPILILYHPYLKQLTHYDVNLTNCGIDEGHFEDYFVSISKELRNVESLSFNFSKLSFDTIHILILQELFQTQLKELDLSFADIKLNQKACQNIGQFLNQDVNKLLRSLKLEFRQCQMGDIGISKIAPSFKGMIALNIFYLGLEKNSISEEGLQQVIKGITPLPEIHDLSLILRTNHIGKQGMAGFGQIHSIKKVKKMNLDVFNNQLQKAGIQAVGVQLSKFSELVEVSLDAGMNIIEDGLIMILGTFFSQMKELRRVNICLELNIIESEPLSQKVEWPLKNLAKTCSLDEFSLNLRNCSGLKEEIIQLFFNVVGCLTSVKKLELKFHKLQNPARLLDHLSKQLTELRSLRQLGLEFSKCKLVDQDMLQFAAHISKSTHLERLMLDFETNNISRHLDKFGDSLGSIKSLSEIELRLSKNPVERDSVNAFFENLSKKSEANILKVILKECNLDDDQLVDCTRSLVRMDSLVELSLDMSGNKVRQRGAISAGVCLNSIKNLKFLNLDTGLRKQQIVYDTSEHYKDLKTSKLTYAKLL